MRKLILAVTFALGFATLFGQSAVLAASSPSQTIDLAGNASFSSILGGSVNGPVAVSGGISDGAIDALRGSANFPLRDEKVTLSPTTSIVLTTEQMNVGWYRFNCGPFGCFYENGVSVFQRSYGSGPVDIRFGSLKGNGTLSLSTSAACVSQCPPPGASWYAPTGYWQLQGAVLSSQDAGGLNIYGSAPTIH